MNTAQNAILQGLDGRKTWLQGPAGSGKTSAAVAWLARRLQKPEAERFLVLTPQRTLWGPYSQLVQTLPFGARQRLELQTISGLSRQMLSLFWPEVMPLAGFDQPQAEPIFLTVDAAQYTMGQLVAPLLDTGRFATITLAPHRLYAQLLDNLNKAALVGFDHTEIGPRLKTAWTGESAQLQVYDDVQDAVSQFRRHCLSQGLVDFSLQVELFDQVLRKLPIFRQYLRKRYQVLLYDNVEEDPPVFHDFILDWLPDLEEALLLYDEEGGLRSFLSADPVSASRLRKEVSSQEALMLPINSLPCFQKVMKLAENWRGAPAKLTGHGSKFNCLRLLPGKYRFFTELLDGVALEIRQLVSDGNAPEKIAVLSPFVSDVLRFALETRLNADGIQVQTLRPSAPGLSDPALRNLTTLAVMAYPAWNLPLDKWHLANALAFFIDDLDIVRAQSLAENMGKDESGYFKLSIQGSDLPEQTQQSITELFDWLQGCQNLPDLRAFFSGIFNSLLSRPGFSFHEDPDLGAKTSSLIDSIRRFNDGLPATADLGGAGKAFIQASLQGLIFGLNPGQWQLEPGKVLLLPATTFLMRNAPVDYQFWLGIASSQWYQRLEQPLTHPYVLSRNWPVGRPWTSQDELNLSQANLDRLVKGLLRRCKQEVILCHSQYSETGNEERGMMLRLLQSVLKHSREGEGA